MSKSNKLKKDVLGLSSFKKKKQKKEVDGKQDKMQKEMKKIAAIISSRGSAYHQ